jgi:DNA-binding CsgD family transcriptional regulator
MPRPGTNKTSDFEAVLHAVAKAPTRQELWTTVLDYLQKEGVTRVSYHAVATDTVSASVIAEGFPEDWVSTYVEQRLIEVDPIPELAARLAEPFFWRDIRKLGQLTSEQSKYLDAMKQAKLGDGIALFVFGPGLRNAYVGMGFGVERAELSKDMIFKFQCVAQAGHLRFCALTGESPTETLSKREQDVLRWIARGKSNSVIAELLEISPHTVDAHVRSIYRKLDVADRTSAAIRGVGRGIVQYPHHVGT